MNASFVSRLVISVVVFSLWGCSGHHVKTDVAPTGFLKDYSMLSKDPDNKISMKYLSPGVEWGKYSKIQLDRVVVFIKKDSEYEGVEPDDLKKLTDHFHQAIFAALGDRFTFVTDAGPDTLRMRIAITDVVPSKPTANTLSSVIPVGLAASVVTRGATGTGLAVGQASVEMEIVDSVGGERLAAAIDHRAGGKKTFRNKWADATDAMDYWSTRINGFLERVGAGK